MRIYRTASFERSLKRLGASDADLLALEDAIRNDPEVGDTIQKTMGARKLRFAMKGKGKKGGGRCIYYYFVMGDAVYLLLAYGKSQQSDLDEDEKKAVRALIKTIETPPAGKEDTP